MSPPRRVPKAAVGALRRPQVHIRAGPLKSHPQPLDVAQPVRLEHLHLPALARHLQLQPVLEPALAGHEELVIARLLALLLLERHALRRELGGALAALGARAGRVDDALRGHGAGVDGVLGGCPPWASPVLRLGRCPSAELELQLPILRAGNTER